MTRAAFVQLLRDVRELAKTSTIDAIKKLRAETGCGLSDAYYAVKRLQDYRGELK